MTNEIKNKYTPKTTTLLTGGLGAGKTTFLNDLLKSHPNTRYAIIENEFGDENIDSEMVMSSDRELIQMNDGCLCCTLNKNLYEIISALHKRRNEFDELIIESTGIADPAGIADPFITVPAVRKAFQLADTICVVDAEYIEDQLIESETARKQITFADTILINKCDLVHNDYLVRLKKLLERINPAARALNRVKHNRDFKTRNLKTASNGSPSEDFFPAPKPDQQPHEHRHGDLITFTLRCIEPVDIDRFYHKLYQYLFVQGENILRIKGILYDKEGKKWILQSVRKRLGIELAPYTNNREKSLNRIVFIGKNIKPGGLEKMLKKSCFRIDIDNRLNKDKKSPLGETDG